MDAMSRGVVNTVLSLLVAGEFCEIERMSGGKRMSASDLEDAVRDYGRTLVIPPSGEFKIDEVELERPGLPGWSVTCALWTREEGRSDLSLELTVLRDGDSVIVEVDDLHVL